MNALRLLYNLAFPFVLVLMLPGFLHRMLKRGKYRHKFGQRFGIYSERVLAKLSARRWIWVHAVSVGEVLVAQKLIRRWKARQPDAYFVLSTTTSTGYRLAARLRSDWLEPIYNPIDFIWPVRRAIRRIRPTHLVLVEAEVWPNLTAEARASGARLVLVNARLSPRSEKRFRAFRPIVAPIFAQLDALCVQEPEDVGRWAALGVKKNKITVCGSIKFDDARTAARPPRDFRPILSDWGVPRDAPILLAGSTHRGEEAIIFGIAKRLREDFPGLFPVIVPRHAERGPEVQAELLSAGGKCGLRTDPPSTDIDALIVNTTGELRDWYEVADVVFIGKSLTATGGQNPAEAIVAGKAVVFGPHMENFAAITRSLLKVGGAIRVADETELEAQIRLLLSDATARDALARAGRDSLLAHRGAADRTCETIAALG